MNDPVARITISPDASIREALRTIDASGCAASTAPPEPDESSISAIITPTVATAATVNGAVPKD